MNYEPNSRVQKTILAGVALVVTVAGLMLIASGFLPADDQALTARREFLDARFESLRIARELASGEVRQALTAAPTQTR
jgi:hypothetical protein